MTVMRPQDYEVVVKALLYAMLRDDVDARIPDFTTTFGTLGPDQTAEVLRMLTEVRAKVRERYAAPEHQLRAVLAVQDPATLGTTHTEESAT